MDNEEEKVLLIQNAKDEISPSQRQITTGINDFEINSMKNNINLNNNFNKDENSVNNNFKKNDNIRHDLFGNEIKKGGKYKVTFSDQKNGDKIEEYFNEENDKKMAEIIIVDSYKKYNRIMNFSVDENNQEIICCKSCSIF
jgi:hypothetical protein